MPITVAELTQSTLEGTGVFDILMRANKAHLDAEYSKNRIRGPEYATVYLGSLQNVLQTALTFLLQKDKADLERQLLEQQIILAGVEVLKAQAELAIITASLPKITAEIALMTAQTAKVNKDVLLADEEIAIKQAQVLIAQAELGIAQAKLINVPKEGTVLDAQAAKLTQEKLNLVSQELLIDAETAHKTQQVANAVIEATVLTAQKCKLDAEFDVLQNTKLKVAQETGLLLQKVATEKAQTDSTALDPASVLGKQIALYGAQTTGYSRDAEQKAAKIMIDTWNVRRTTDETGTTANASNKLDDVYVGNVVTKLLTGVGA